MARCSQLQAVHVVVLAMLLMAAISMVPAARAEVPNCENHGSNDPTVSVARQLADSLISLGTTPCCQTHNGGDYCTVMRQLDPYNVRICGPYNACINCADAGGLTYDIINGCQGGRSDGRVSGNVYKNPPGVDIVLRNKAN